MAKINYDSTILRTKATELMNYKETHDGNMAHVTALVNGLTDIWEGDALNAFQASFQEMQSTITNFSAMLEDLATKMRYAADYMEESEGHVASQM